MIITIKMTGHSSTCLEIAAQVGILLVLQYSLMVVTFRFIQAALLWCEQEKTSSNLPAKRKCIEDFQQESAPGFRHFQTAFNLLAASNLGIGLLAMPCLRFLQGKLQKVLKQWNYHDLTKMPQKCLQADSILFAKKLLSWFKENKRDLPWRKESSRYRILVTEKLLQQTDVAHVVKIYEKFFDYYPTLEALAAADQEEIANTIKPLGFWRIRSRDLKLLANQLLDQYYGVIPCDKHKLLQLFGIGDYIANAVLCFGFGRKEALVDVNVRRVAKRLFFWK